MGGSLHRLELILVGIFMLLATLLIGVYMLVRPGAPTYDQAPPVPVGRPQQHQAPAQRETWAPPRLIPTAVPAIAPPAANRRPGEPQEEPPALPAALHLPLGLEPWMLAGILVIVLGGLMFQQRLSPALLAPSRGTSLFSRQHTRRGWRRSLQRLLHVPATDPLIQVRGELLKWAALLIGTSGCLALIIAVWKDTVGGLLPYEILGLLAVCALVFALAHWGRLVAGGLLLGLGLIPLILYLEPLPELLERPFGAAFMLPVLIVGMVVGANAARWTGGLVLGIVAGLALMMEPPGSLWTVDLLMVLSLESGLIWLTIRTLERALLAVRHAAALEHEHTLLEQQHRETERQALVLASQLDEQRQAREFVGHFLHELGGLAVGARGTLEVLPSPSLVAIGAALPGDMLFDDEEGGAEGLFEALKDNLEEMHLLLDDLKILLRQGSLPETQRQRISVAALFEHVAQLALPSHPGIEVVVDVSPPDLVICGDEALLRRALITAIRNAIQAMMRQPQWRQHARITLRGSEAHDRITLRVEDSGPGFPPEMLRKMRTLVMRPAGTLPTGWFTDKAGGSGRGVPLLDQVARLHQGSLGFGNELGQPGAWVQLQLPGQGVLTEQKSSQLMLA